MLLKLFRGTGPFAVFLVIVLAILLWFGSFIKLPLTASFSADISPMPVYGLLKGALAFSNLASVIFTFIMVLLISFMMVNLNTALFFINERTFLPAVLYLLITGIFPEKQALNPVLPAVVLILLALRRIMDSYRLPGTAYNFFDAAVLVSTGALFYANTIFFWLLIVSGIALLRTGSPKELFISVIGLLTPLGIMTGVLYVSGYNMTYLSEIVVFNFMDNNRFNPEGPLVITTLLIIAVAAIASISRVALVSRGMKIKSRKTFSMLFWMLIISLLTFFIIPSASAEIIFFAAIPLSYYITWLLLNTKKRIIAEILFSVIFILTAIIQVLNII